MQQQVRLGGQRGQLALGWAMYRYPAQRLASAARRYEIRPTYFDIILAYQGPQLEAPDSWAIGHLVATDP